MLDKGQNQNLEPHEVEGKGKAGGTGEREALLQKRRARQTGASRRGSNAKLTMAVGLLAASAVLFAVVAGPSAAMRIFGITGDGAQKTSRVNLEVDREAEEQSRLDFVVPASSEPVKKADPVKESGLSAAEIQKLLASNNDNLTRKLEKERKTMAEEAARLRAEAETQRLRAASLDDRQKIDQKQRESGAVIVDEGQGPAGSGGLTGVAAGDDASVDLNANQRFLKSAASSIVQTSVSQELPDPSRTVVQGTIISAVLESAIDTELPGSIRAQVMRPVYSFDGTRVLMPSGTILIGDFNNDIDVAQKRVLIAWNRAITPEGKSIALGSIGTDVLGRSGTLGNVDNRYATKFGAAVLISAITAAPAMLTGIQGGGQEDSSGTTINVGGGGKLASKVGDAAGEQGSDMLEKYLSLPPVIRIPQGEEIRIFANRDLVFQ